MTRYYCHVCNDSTDARLDSGTPTCPECESDFVEELDAGDLPPNFDILEHAGVQQFEFQGGDNAALANSMFQMLSSAFMPPTVREARQGATEHQGHASGDRNINEQNPPRPAGRRFNFHAGGIRPTTSGPENNPMLRGIASLLSDQFGNEHPLNALFGNMMSGNPGDYAFGQQGLDDIITRLMDEVSRSNALPAKEEDIEGLPQVEFVKETHGSFNPCPICQDDFEPKILVVKMPCDHLFHKSCIEYWLKINGNCPSCRMRVDGSVDKKASEDPT